MAEAHTIIGRGMRRIEGREKVTGQTSYVADYVPAGTTFGRLVISPYAHARVRHVSTGRAERAPGVLGVFTERDLGEGGFLARDEVFYVGEPVAVVVAESPEAAQDAAELVEIDFEPLPVVSDAEKAMAPSSPLTRTTPTEREGEGAEAHGAAVSGDNDTEAKPRNVNNMTRLQRGNVEQAWARADVVIEDTYRIAPVHQGYLETHGSVGLADDDGSLDLWTSTQGQFFVRRYAAQQLKLPDHRVRVVPMTVGGGFGGKIYLLETLVGELSRRVGRPVRIVLDRSQDFLVSHPGPAAIIKLRMGVTHGGDLTGLQAQAIFDSGAAPGAPTGIAGLFLGSTYRLPNLDVVGYEVLTHKSPVGAYRAPGAPQAYFALESHMTRLARAIGADDIEFRLRHAVREGDEMPNGRVWPRIGLIECLEMVQQHPLRQAARGRDHQGVGVAVGGWMGGMEPAAAVCRVNADGSLTLQVGSVDITGVNTVFAQIAAEVFQVDPGAVQVVQGDTDHAPYAGMSGGSKTIYSSGPAVQRAVQDARQQLLEMAAEELEIGVADLELAGGQISVRGIPSKSIGVAELAQMSMSFGGKYPPINGQGRAATHNQSPAFAVHVAHVEVDPDTGRVRPLEYLAVQDVGKALNPAEVEGQIHGGVAQGIGRSLHEALIYDEQGQLLDGNFADYGLPSAEDIPHIDVRLVEVASEYGPFGAKGVGEPPTIPVAGAVGNAVADAIGTWVTQVPMTPGVIRGTLAEK